MATETKKSKKNGSSNGEGNGKSSKKKFREEQREAALEQNQKAENAVPEQRPIASQQPNMPESPVKEKLKESDEDDSEPMDKAAYEAADQESDEGMVPSVKPGAYILVTDGPYEGASAVVLDVSYDGPEEEAKARSGVASVANFAIVASVSAKTRGDRLAYLNLTPEQFEVTTIDKFNRGIA